MDGKGGFYTGRTVDIHSSTMGFDDIVCDAQAQAGSLCSFFRGKKRLQDFVFYVVGDARAVVFDLDGDGATCFFCSYGEAGGVGRHSSRTAALRQTLEGASGGLRQTLEGASGGLRQIFGGASLGTGVEGICTQVQDDPGEVFGNEGHFAD